MTVSYSPTRTQRYQQCPRLCDLSDRWEEKSYQFKPNRLLGSAVAAGLEAHYKGYDQEATWQALGSTIAAGLPTGTDYQEKSLYKLAQGGLKAGVATGLPLGGDVLMVEEEIDGRRPDLVYRAVSGGVVVVDHKVTLSLGSDASRAAEYRLKRGAEWQDNWQALDYAWHVSQHYGEPVERVGMHLIELQPKPRATLYWAELSQERLDVWHHQAEVWWGEMEDIAVVLGPGFYKQNHFACHSKYGTCLFLAGCHTLLGREELFDTLYQRKPPRVLEEEG